MPRLQISDALPLIALLFFTPLGLHASDAEKLLGEAGFSGGFIVHLGTTDGKLTSDLKIDEYSYNIARDPVSVHDFHATLLHLLGIDHRRLTYRFQGRDYRLTDVHGEIIRPILS